MLTNDLPEGDIEVDIVVIGGGPAGMHTALEAARHGRRVAILDEEPDVGGACVRRGTIPSKTLRETAVSLDAVGRKSAGVVELALPDDTALESLLSRTRQVVVAHERTWSLHLRRAGVLVLHGRASFVAGKDGRMLQVETVRRQRYTITATTSVVIASGSRPRTPSNIPVDHEVILDSDSILSLPWLPKSLVVLGGGVIATEYASIFAALGVEVIAIDKAQRPLGFLDAEIVDCFLTAFNNSGGTFIGGRTVTAVEPDAGGVRVSLDDGEVLQTDKVLVALGRVANVERLRIENVGLSTDHRGLLVVDAAFRTSHPHIFAVGDVIGPPSLASTSMEQGRRAGRHACGLAAVSQAPAAVPVGVYAIPEMASIGLSEAEAAQQGRTVVVGRAHFADTARGVIAAAEGGLLKLVVNEEGDKILGVHIVGEGAAELVHLGQLAMLGGLSPQVFVEQAFNIPTMAEAYRIAALEAAHGVERHRTSKAALVANRIVS
jgi:NAD(P) transhydrogenase